MAHSNQAAPWQATAAYLYVLRLDATDLAWEYLRRHPDYRACWRNADHQTTKAVSAWGLARLENPTLDARQAHPVWDERLPALLHLRAAHPSEWLADEMVDAAADSDAGLNLWHIPGRKDLTVLPGGLALQARDGARCLRARLDAGVLAGAPAQCVVPLDTRLHAQAALLATHAAQLAPRRASTARAVARTAHAVANTIRVSQASLRHLRALQALDGLRAGASQRRITEVLYGPDRVREEWQADSALRAQLRHSLARAWALMRGGYLGLAGLRHAAPDE
ncbi:DUF2285 domain-containing protein [Alcaligenaceae bacterium]|nr:DUF2285 domain-containing protein [Alcaligenaceae bacterium]